MRFDDRFLRLRGDAMPGAVQETLVLAAQRFGSDLAEAHLPIEEEALRQLEFSDLLPAAMAAEVVSVREVDLVGAARVPDQGVVGRHVHG